MHIDEPVLLPESDIVVAVLGLSALGRSLKECCFRLEKAKKLLSADENHLLTEKDMAAILLSDQAAAVVGLLATFNEQFRQGVGITKIITLAEELPATIRNYKSGMTAFADELHKGKRTPDGYAQVFGRRFSGQPKLSLDDKSWQAFSNTTIQYVSSVRSAQDAPQLMRRMHYSFFNDIVGSVSSFCRFSKAICCFNF